MKHEVLTRAIGELDDELIADAYAYKPRKRYALPRFLAAAACLVLVLAAALAMTRDTLPAEIKVEGAALAGPSKSRTRVRFTRSLSTARPPSRCATTRPTAIGLPRGRKHPIPHYY